jgi:S1-C subfamily serine protease
MNLQVAGDALTNYIGQSVTNWGDLVRFLLDTQMLLPAGETGKPFTQLLAELAQKKFLDGGAFGHPDLSKVVAVAQNVKGATIAFNNEILGKPEAIVFATYAMRPPLRVTKEGFLDIPANALDATPPSLTQFLKAYQTNANLVNAVNCVGKIRKSSPTSKDPPLFGTGWVIHIKFRESILPNHYVLTNRHVLLDLSLGDTGKSDSNDFEMVFEINGVEVTKKVKRMVWKTVQADLQTDVALLKLDSPLDGVKPLEFRDTPMFSDLMTRRTTKDPYYAFAIGYPASDATRNDPKIMEAMFQSVYNVKRASPGEVVFHDVSRNVLYHDASTLGGNSGSPLYNPIENKVVGLHYGGDCLINNYAVASSHCLMELPKFVNEIENEANWVK